MSIDVIDKLSSIQKAIDAIRTEFDEYYASNMDMEQTSEFLFFIDTTINDMDVDVRNARRAATMGNRAARSRPARMKKPSARPRKRSAYQTWAEKERKLIARQHPRFDFARTQTELSKRWKREKKKRGKK